MFLYPFKKIYFETGKSKVSFKIDNRKSYFNNYYNTYYL